MTISRNIFILFLFFFVCQTLSAQQKISWKKHVKLAEEAFKKAQYADAGNHYQQAWRQKTKNKELIYKAGECFFIIRDYKNAASAWEHVKNDNDKFELIGLRHARALKQSGDYDGASRAFVEFIGKYAGDDKTFVSSIVQNEIRGCELAMDWNAQGAAPETEVMLLSSNINTPETEFAPFPFSDEILYFSSTMAKRAEIYRSQKLDGLWTKAVIPQSFPKVEQGHFCNGTLTPDQKRFYFTICESVESWGGLTTRCEIHVTTRDNKTWSAPQKLREYINMEGVTTTHPFVVHKNGKEILYFASNRGGGQGGMDIWYTTRDISSNAIDFTFPINLGSTINTAGDEITPYYNDQENFLYFASNAHVTTGGYDIFKSRGAKSQWDKVENIGKPYNSPADDFSFVKSPTGKTGFLVSNRTHGMEKITTTDEDIFEFALDIQKEIYAKGAVYENATGEILAGATLSLYEHLEDGSKKLIINRSFDDGNYYFDLLPEKKYSIEAHKDGYFPKPYDFDTQDFLTYDDFGAPIYLEHVQEEPEKEVAVEDSPTYPEENPVQKKQVNTKPTKEREIDQPATVSTKEEEKIASKSKEELETVDGSDEEFSPTAVKNSDYKDKTYRTRGRANIDKHEIETKSPISKGTYFKVQLIAVVKFDINHSRYRPVEDIKRLDTEYIVDKKLTRVLLGDYESIDDALLDRDKVRKFKNFERAFIVKYVDGERIGRVRL